MLEGNISALLSSTLSKVFEEKCLTKDNIESDIYNGHLRYFNLEIKKSFLDSLSVPVGVVRGVVKSLSLHVTTASIFSNDPLKIIVEDLCLIVEPIDNYPIEDSIRNYYNAKLSEINIAEVKRQLQKAVLTKEEGGKDEGGFLSGLLRNIINNLEVTLLGIHLRYEDHLSDTPFFCFGAVVESLTFNSLSDPRLDAGKSYKQLSIKNSKIYFNNSLVRNWDDYSLLEMIDLLKLPDEGNINLVNIPDLSIYIASTKKNYDLEKPDQSIYIQVPHIELSLSHTQYLYLMHTSDFFTWTANRDNYSVIRKEVLGDECKQGDVIADKPKLLWQYGIKCIIRNIHKMKCSYNRKHLSKMWSYGQKYCKLYKKKLELEADKLSLSKEEQDEYIECENILPTPTILVWRSHVEAQLAEVNEPPSLKQYLVSFFFPSTETSESPEPQFSIEDLNSESLPSNYVKTMVRVTVKEIKFRLIADNVITNLSRSKQIRNNEKVLCCLFLNDTTFSLSTGYGWWEISCGINNMALKDYTSNQQKLKYLLCRNDEYHYNDSKLYMDKRDMIQLKLKYGENLFIYCNMNNIDIYLNSLSLLNILSFFDLHKNTIVPPKQEKPTTSAEDPRLFTIMTYLYTVHPSITISNLHVYVPEDTTNVDSSLLIITIPEILFRDNSVKTELTEEEKDLIVLNNYASSRLSLANNPILEEKATEDVQGIDRVLVSCQIIDFHVILCDLNDLYDDSHYVMNHKLKIIQNLNCNLLLAFPLLHEDRSPEKDVLVTVSFQVSPLVVNLDTIALNRLFAILDVLMNAKKITYNEAIMSHLTEAPSAGFFTVSSSSVFGNLPKESQDTIFAIFEDYVSPLKHNDSSSSGQQFPTIQSNDYLSVNSDSRDSFHSLAELHEDSTLDDDFQSINDSASNITGETEESDDSFVSMCEDNTIPFSSKRNPRQLNRRRNSVFSVTSATHSLGRSSYRGNPDRFVSIGGIASDKPGDDYQTVVESEVNDESSLSTASSKKRTMHLNFSVFDILPIDFPMFDLDKIHPYYLSIKPESLTVDISVTVQSIKVTITEKNTDKDTHGVGLVLNGLRFESSHRLMARFFDASIRELGLVAITSNDFYNNNDVLNDFKYSPFYLSSDDNVVTLKSTFYMPRESWSGRVIYYIQLGLFNVSANHSLYEILKVAGHLLDSHAPSIQHLMIPKEKTQTTSITSVTSTGSSRELEIHFTVDGIDFKVFNIHLNGREKEYDDSLCYLRACLNTVVLNIQKKEGLSLTGSLEGCSIELGSENTERYIVLTQLSEETDYDLNNKLVEFEMTDHAIQLKINKIHVLIDPFSLLQSVDSVLTVVDQLPIPSWPSIQMDESQNVATEVYEVPPKKELCYSFELNQPLIELLVNENVLVGFECSSLKLDYNPLFFYDITLAANQLELYSIFIDSKSRIDFCSDLTGLLSVTFNETPLYGIIQVELQRLLIHCYPDLFVLISSLQSLMEVVTDYMKMLKSHSVFSSSKETTHSDSVVIPPFERIELVIDSCWVNMYDDLHRNLIALGIEGFQSAFTLNNTLNGNLVMNSLSLVINDNTNILISHTHSDSPLLFITIENQIITSSLSSLSIVVPSSLSETIYSLLSVYKPYFAMLGSSSTKNESGSSSQSHIKELLYQQYFIETSIENCDLTLSAITPMSTDSIQLNLNCGIKLSMNNMACYCVSFQFYNFTITLTHQLIKDNAVYYESNNSLIETGLSFSVVYNTNVNDRSRKIRISSSLDEVDLMHITDTNNNNAIVLNLNTIQDLVSVVSFLINSFSVFGSTSSSLSSSPKHQQPHSTDIIEIGFPKVVLRYSLYNSLYFFISVDHFKGSFTHTGNENRILCDLDLSIQYEMNSPLQFVLNKVSFHTEVNMHENHLVVSASIDQGLMLNFPSEILVAMNRSRANETKTDSSTYSILQNCTGVEMRIEGEDKNGNKELICDYVSDGEDKASSNYSKYNYLILTLSTSFGNYLPVRIPVHHMVMSNQEQEQSEVVNFSIQPDTELEANLEQVFTIPENQGNARYHRLISLMQNNSINVQYRVTKNEGIMEVCSTAKIVNDLDIPVFVSILFGHSLLFSKLVKSYSSVPVPPYAYMLSHLHIFVIPVVFSAEEQLVSHCTEITDLFPLFNYSAISIGMSGIQDGVYRCNNQNVLHDVEEDCHCYLRELVDVLYISIQLSKGSNSNYVLTLSPPVTIVNQLPTRVDIESSFSSQLPPGGKLPFYDMDFSRYIKVTPFHFETKNVLSLKELCGDGVQALENRAYMKVDEVKTCFDCIDKNHNSVSLNCHIHWEKGALQFCFFVPYWLVNLTNDPLQFRSSIRETVCYLPNQMNYAIAEKTQYAHGVPIHGLEWLCEHSEEILLMNHDDSLLICGKHTFWSSSINYKSLYPEQSRPVTLTDKGSLFSSNRFTYHYMLECSQYSSIYCNTRVLTLVNRYCIYNNTQIPLEFKQTDAADSSRILLHPFQVQALQLCSSYKPEVVIRGLNKKYAWSYTSIVITGNHTKTESFLLYCKDLDSTNRLFLEVVVDCQYNGCVNFVINETPYDENNLPVIFNNHTIFPITIHQKDCCDRWTCPPFKIIPFFWGDLAKNRSLQLHIYNHGNTNNDTSIPLVNYLVNCNQSKNRMIVKFVHPETRETCCLIVNVELLKNKLLVSVKHYSAGSHSSFVTSYEGQYARAMVPKEHMGMHIELKVPSVHMTLLNTSGNDLFCLNLNTLVLQIKMEQRKDFSLSIQSLQLDDQLVQCHYPAVLFSRGSSEQPAVYLHCALQEEDTAEYGNCMIVSLMEISIQPVFCVIEGLLIEECVKLLKDIQKSTEVAAIISYNSQNPQSLSEYVEWMKDHRNQFVYAYPYSEVIHVTKPIISHRQIYEESKHTRVKKVVISSLELHLSLSVGSVFSSWIYDFYTLQDIPLVLSPVLLQEKYPRRFSYVMSQLKSLYLRSAVLQIPQILGSLRVVGNPTRVVKDLAYNLRSLFSDCINTFTDHSLVYSIPLLVDNVIHYLDRNLTSFSLVIVDSAFSLLSSVTMFFQFLSSLSRPYIYHGEITQISPYIQNPKKGYHFIPYLLRQGRSLILQSLYHISLASYPLQYLCKNLQDFRSTLSLPSGSVQRVKSPNVSIDGILTVYDEVYSRGREILAVVGQCGYCNEDILSVYSFNYFELIVTRNRFMFISKGTKEYAVKCDIRFEDCIGIHEKHNQDESIDLCFTCMKNVTLFGNSNFSTGNPFGLRFVEKRIHIGKGHSASRVAVMICDILEKEIAHHNSLWKYCYSLNSLH